MFRIGSCSVKVNKQQFIINSFRYIVLSCKSCKFLLKKERIVNNNLKISQIMTACKLDFTNSFSKDSCGNGAAVEANKIFSKSIRYEEYKKEINDKELTDSDSCLIKVMNYNVLSQKLLDMHKYLYRYQPEEVLKWDYRSERLLKEIIESKPDIICLQEVQESHVDTFYSKFIDLGYKSIFKRRTGNKCDGCAIYYKDDLFTLQEVAKVEYYQPDIFVLNRDNIGLVARFSLKNMAENNQIVVATTHLLYNPKRIDVRLAQTQVLLAEVHRIAKWESDRWPVILTGDFNSTPYSPVIRLLKEGYLAHSFTPLPFHLGILPSCKHSSDKSKLYNSEDEIIDLSIEPEKNDLYLKQREYDRKLSHPFNFNSVYDDDGGYYKSNATTYQDQWVTVDYIFYSYCEKLELISRLRLPTAGECEKYIEQLPNYICPSDHLPLVASFLFKSN